MSERESSMDFRALQWTLPRREVLRRLAEGVALGTLGIRWLTSAAQESGADEAGAEAFWAQVKNQFPIRSDLIIMNAANLCPTHYSVLERFFGLTRDLDSDVSFQNRAKFADTKNEARRLLADYVGALPEEIAITRNTSEGNNIIVNGLELGRGDEVLVWGENHPSNHLAWSVRARRHGFSVKELPTPQRWATADDLVEHFVGALTPRTRLFAFSHVSNLSGIALPARTLCHECRDRDVLTLVDGAQTLGALSLDLPDMGCDFFTGSLHKWPMGPKETGLLYVRQGLSERVWPSMVSLGYEAAEEQGARKLEILGQRGDPTVAAVVPTIEFHDAIGKTRIEARLREIVTRLRSGIAEISGVDILTPAEAGLNAGILVLRLPGVAGRPAFEALYRDHGVGVAPASINDGIRLSPHVYNTLADVDRVVGALREIAA